MGEQGGVDFDALADLLKAMAYPARLELLGMLRERLTLREIRLTPRRGEGDGSPGRPAAPQTVKRHLDQLIENGLVRPEDVPRGGREQISYVANPATFYAVIEALRSLLVQYAGMDLEPDHTQIHGPPPPAPQVRGPRLVLVRGVYEGKAYPLTDSTARNGQWTIGRDRKLAVGLDYDPFVSRESAVVTRTASGFAIADLGSRNGTMVNWNPVAPGEPRPLEPSDVISVGRSLLVFAP